MAELTPRDDIKKTVSEILKRVDQLLKAGSLEEASAQITKAREVDPKNVYISAYDERLSVLKEEKKKRDEEEARRKAEEQQRRLAEEERRKKEEEKRKAEEEVRKKAEAERLKKEEEQKRKREEEEKKQQERPAARAIPEISRDVLEETKRKILDERKKKGLPPPEIASSHGSAYEQGLEIYHKILAEAWEDGATTADEREQLKNLRASLQIRPEDHERLERDVKVDAYRLAFHRAWSSGAISPESASSLADLRKKFNITIDEHEQIEAQLLWELRSSNQKARIVVIDDDEKLLKVISDSLQDAGFQTLPFTTTDEAFKALKDTTPDLILSDINLETSTMGGFSFYEKIREIDRLHEIPFIFLSGLTDEVLIRTGKELGVDDYITKPFSHDTLIATIKGKLKRYRQLKKSRK